MIYHILLASEMSQSGVSVRMSHVVFAWGQSSHTGAGNGHPGASVTLEDLFLGKCFV